MCCFSPVWHPSRRGSALLGENIYIYIYIYIYTYIFLFFSPEIWHISPMRGLPNRTETTRQSPPDSHYHRLLMINSAEPIFHKRPPDCFIHPAEEITTARYMTPRQMLRHSFLSCTLTFASWMLRPFLSNASFTPFIQLFLGLPLLLTPVTSDSYTLLTNFSFPILST